MRRSLPLLLLLLAACSPVRQTRLRDDYAADDRTRTVRLKIVVAPLPEGGQDVGDLWAMMARSHVNQHRDFIVTEDLAAAEVPADACAEGIEGLLRLEPDVKRAGDGVEAGVKARLTRCRDGEEVWAAEAAGSWDSDDDDLEGVRAHWVQELGEPVSAYVVPSFRLLTATLDELPRPAFPSEAYAREKINLGE
jgi:probable lipoprotein (TIGR04455 family)